MLATSTRIQETSETADIPSKNRMTRVIPAILRGKGVKKKERERERKHLGASPSTTRLNVRTHNARLARARLLLRTCAHACAAYRRPRNRDNVIDDDIERRSNRPRAFLRAVSKPSPSVLPAPPPCRRLAPCTPTVVVAVADRRLGSTLAPMPTVGCHLWI
jgi:hypothetical protein